MQEAKQIIDDREERAEEPYENVEEAFADYWSPGKIGQLDGVARRAFEAGVIFGAAYPRLVGGQEPVLVKMRREFGAGLEFRHCTEDAIHGSHVWKMREGSFRRWCRCLGTVKEATNA